jgi:hypothetical protein
MTEFKDWAIEENFTEFIDYTTYDSWIQEAQKRSI